MRNASCAPDAKALHTQSSNRANSSMALSILSFAASYHSQCGREAGKIAEDEMILAGTKSYWSAPMTR